MEEGVDLAARIGRLAESSLVARRLAPMRRVVCASPAYLAARGVPCAPDDLAGHECLGYSTMAQADEWRFVAPDGRVWPVEVRGRLRVNNSDALRIAALDAEPSRTAAARERPAVLRPTQAGIGTPG